MFKRSLRSVKTGAPLLVLAIQIPLPFSLSREKPKITRRSLTDPVRCPCATLFARSARPPRTRTHGPSLLSALAAASVVLDANVSFAWPRVLWPFCPLKKISMENLSEAIRIWREEQRLC